MKSLAHDSEAGGGHFGAARSLEVHVVTPSERERFDGLLAAKHYLGQAPPVGDFLRQVVVRQKEWVGLLVWGPAALKLKDREKWMGWNPALAAERLKLIVQNRRYLLLHERGAEPNLASAALAAACRALPGQWEARFGYRPLVAESFTDPEGYAGTCYKASGWQPVGMSDGNSRHRADFFVPNGRPKRLWLKELQPGARQKACAVPLAPEHAGALVEAAHGVLPLDQKQRLGLLELLRRAPDPRAKNTRFRIGPVLSIVAMALLGGARQISEIARFATRLKPAQRAELGLPIKKGTRRFYEVPSYDVFYDVLTRMDPEPFAALLSGWLGAQAGALPGALALDGKMIREIIGMVSLVDVEDGSPVAMAVIDQKENTDRCEQKVAQELLGAVPCLDGKTVTADPLHCQKQTARIIVEKGGEYFLQIKANQPTLLQYARHRPEAPPLLSRPTAAMGASKSAPCGSARPSRWRPAFAAAAPSCASAARGPKRKAARPAPKIATTFPARSQASAPPKPGSS